MSVTLYRQGTSYTIRGVVCEMQVFHHEDIDNQLKDGWFKSPGEAYAIPEAVLEEGEGYHEEEETIRTEETDGTKEEAEEIGVLNLEGMSSKEVRELSRLRGIEDWDKKRIATLKAELADGNR